MIWTASPAGISAAISASASGLQVALVDRNDHPGSRIPSVAAQADSPDQFFSSGIFLGFRLAVMAYYEKKYGSGSAQKKACTGGFRFEPHVAEKILRKMLDEQDNIHIFSPYELDADEKNVEWKNGLPQAVIIRKTGNPERQIRLKGKIFLDAGEEGDLAAAFGCRFRNHKEGAAEFGEEMPDKYGTIPESGAGINAIAAEHPWLSTGLHFQLCLTKNEDFRKSFRMPEGYNRNAYLRLAEEIRSGRILHFISADNSPGSLLHSIYLPNEKREVRPGHWLMTARGLPDTLPDYALQNLKWRDSLAEKLKLHYLGLLFFAQNDPAVPENFRKEAAEYGLAKDEYRKNHGFPWYLRSVQGRRTEGKYLFTAHDGLPEKSQKRTPVHRQSVFASRYFLKRADSAGILSHHITLPFGIMVPQERDNLICAVPVSASWRGNCILRNEFSSLMGLGEAAGTAAAIAIRTGKTVHSLNVEFLQNQLIKNGIQLTYIPDIPVGHPDFDLFQKAGLLGWIPNNEARPDAPVSQEELIFLSGKTGFSLKELSEAGKGISRKNMFGFLLAKWNSADISKKP